MILHFPKVSNESDGDFITDIEPLNVGDFKAREDSTGVIKWVIAFMRAVFNMSDAATSFMFKFLSILLGILAKISVPCSTAKGLPLSLYKLQQLSGDLKQFCCYVVCGKCDCVRCLC